MYCDLLPETCDLLRSTARDFTVYVSCFSSPNNSFSGCNCQNEGSKNLTCDKRYGKCVCKPNIIGDKCDKCIDGFFGFPNCQSKWLIHIFNISYLSSPIFFQAAIVNTRDQKVCHVTKVMESVSASHTLLVTNVTNVSMDSMGFQIVKVSR